ncbi:hypothetical protein SSP35_11_00120 [Streptomyces sp. NBRC 110611]|nr:hypothetical protein SSP35_11_00120 [Streptomyces sp. NBRC 110611]
MVLRTSALSRMAHTVDGAVVAFQADQFDAAAHSGWSVLVTGRAALVTDPREKARLRAAGLRSWAAVADEAFIRITPELVDGRILQGHGPAEQVGGCFSVSVRAAETT